MFAIDFYSPYIVIFGLLLLAALVFLWNRKNTTTNRNRRQRNFKTGYLERKKEREAKERED